MPYQYDNKVNCTVLKVTSPDAMLRKDSCQGGLVARHSLLTSRLLTGGQAPLENHLMASITDARAAAVQVVFQYSDWP